MKPRLLIISLCLAFHLPAQYERGIFFEIAGSGGFGSLNYEKTFWSAMPTNELSLSTPYVLTWRAGISFTPIDKNNGSGIIFPVMVNCIWGQKKHKLDVGLGQTFTITTRGSFYFRMPLSVCYRFQREGGRFFYRAGYTPIVSYLFDFQWEHWAGFSIGYTLNK
jgi:hypothetical protein